MRFDNRPAECETEPDATRLRRTKRMKQSVSNLSAHARAAIRYTHLHLAIGPSHGANNNLTQLARLCSHRFDGITNQINENLLYLHAVDIHRRKSSLYL